MLQPLLRQQIPGPDGVSSAKGIYCQESGATRPARPVGFGPGVWFPHASPPDSRTLADLSLLISLRTLDRQIRSYESPTIHPPCG
jgi:hypothetical protein